jgi:hypothetical protein
MSGTLRLMNVTPDNLPPPTSERYAGCSAESQWRARLMSLSLNKIFPTPATIC